MAKYKLKEGVILSPCGGNSKIDNSNLADDIAEYLLEQGRASLDDFEPIEGEPIAPIEPAAPIGEELKANTYNGKEK